jgi:hypothetical protein
MSDVKDATGVDADSQLQWSIFKMLNWCSYLKTKNEIEQQKMEQWRIKNLRR